MKIRTLTLIAAVGLMTSATGAQTAPPELETKLSQDQKLKIAEVITNEAKPVSNINFTFAAESIVPRDIELHILPHDAEVIAAPVRGLKYLAVDELIALIDPDSRKIVVMLPRVRRQESR